MRQRVRSVFVVFLAVIGAVALGVASALTAAVTQAATALIVPGTGDPNANVIENYMQNFVDRYMDDTFCAEDDSCDTVGENLIGIDYPASFWPLVFFSGWCEPGRCEKWNVSVQDGVAGLNAQLLQRWAANPDEQIVLGGYSQGGAVVSNELRNLASLDPELKEQLQVVMIGNIANPDGGLWQRLSLLNILSELLLDATLGPPMITDIGVSILNVGFEYDPVVFAPKYWGNPLAMLNALAAFDNVHGYYLSGPNRPGSGTLPYGYTDEELAEAMNDPDNWRFGGNDPNSNNKYIMIPATSLPLANGILALADSIGIKPFVKPFVDLLAPVAKVIIDLGYDWSGDPDVAQGLSILPFNPFQDWLKVGADLIVAVQEGVQAFLGNFSAPSLPTPFTAPPSTAEQPAVEAMAVEDAPAETPSTEPRLRLLTKDDADVVADPATEIDTTEADTTGADVTELDTTDADDQPQPGDASKLSLVMDESLLDDDAPNGVAENDDASKSQKKTTGQQRDDSPEPTVDDTTEVDDDDDESESEDAAA